MSRSRGMGSKEVWQFVTGGQEHVMSHLYIFYRTYETWNFKWCLTFCCNRCILTEGGTDKNHPRQKTLWQNPGQKPPRTIEREFVQGAFVRVSCTRSTKNRGAEMCDVLWGSRNVWQSVTSVTIWIKIGQK